MDSRCPMSVSAYSLSWYRGRVGEDTVRYRMGRSAGLTFLKLGGVVMDVGRRRWARPMADCTSRAAASTSRSRANWMMIRVRPTALTELMESMPAMVKNSFSSGVATEAAMVSGSAPGRSAIT